MRRLLLIAMAGSLLAGCSSFSLDAFQSAPPPVKVQIESTPPGADAVTSVGPGCKTPCTIDIPATNSFTVTYTLPKFQPATVSVQVVQTRGDFTTPASTTIDPNPVFAELQPAAPVKRVRRVVAKRRPTAPPPPAAGSPFPAPPPR